jgi:hypothetical protein
LLACTLCVLTGRTRAAEPALTIAAQGRSTLTIIEPEKAPASVQAAALELQRDIAQATGAKISIQKDSAKASGSFISLGATKQAAAAGVNIEGVPDEGFRILTKNGNLYILGPDTAALISSSRDSLPYDTYKLQPDIPGPQLTKNGGFSNGTANGVYTFLEDYLDVRWLMPGDLGRDVPKRSTLEIPVINRIEAPAFIWREFPYLQNTRAAAAWRDQQKLGFSFRLNFNHNWIETVPPEMYKDHPDWFAMIGGKRPAPPTSGPHRKHYKLETTNPELVEFFAQRAIAFLKADPHANTFSLSPSDSRGWSESPASKALYDPPPPGSELPSMTPLVLKWYHDVSAAVAREYPAGKLAGYLYSDARFPPVKGDMKLPDNFTPVIVLGDGGYRLYREESHREAAQIMAAWTKVAPPIWFYYSFATWLRSSSGTFTPAAPENLNFTFSLLRQGHIKGARLYGTDAWSQGAMTNYLQAKLLWNPQLDAKQLRQDWLHRAYGAQAGAVMEQFHQKLDDAFAQYWQRTQSANHNTTEPLFKNLYGARYAEWETLFLQAAAQPMTEPQKQRLELIEENLIVLQWRLRNAGYLPREYSSPLRRSDAQVVQLLLAEHKDFDYFPGILKSGPAIKPVKVQRAAGAAPSAETSAIPNASYILLYCTRAGEVHLTPRNAQPGSSFLSYAIRENDERGTVLQSGILYNGADITFKAKANTAYYFSATPTGIDVLPKAAWELAVADAAPATATFQQGVLRLYGPDAPLLVYLPAGLPMSIESEKSGVLLRPKTSEDKRNEAAQELYPQAKPVQELNSDWRFTPDPQNTGLEQGFAVPEFNDAAWKTVSATDWWQNQGFGNYHGAAWYRKTFALPPVPGDQLLILFFGAVDGDAEVYFNGQKVGGHALGADGKGWNEPFGMDVTAALKPGQNTVAVKVTKTNNMGGIYKGVSLLMMEDTGTF